MGLNRRLVWSSLDWLGVVWIVEIGMMWSGMVWVVVRVRARQARLGVSFGVVRFG
jgi:hypothetical protein